KGMGTIEVRVRRLQELIRNLSEIFHYWVFAQGVSRRLFLSQAVEIFGEIISIAADRPNVKSGRGSIHHLAIRVKEAAELRYWYEKIRKRGFQTTGVLERYYFKSVYFRESNGLMFELATDGPGFMRDSDEASLGEQLDLPPYLEAKRESIEASLPSIEE